MRLSVREWIEWAEVGFKAARELRDQKGQGIHLSYLGDAHRYAGDTHQAIGYYEQALATDRAIGDKQQEGGDLLHLGAVYADLVDDMQKGIAYSEQALGIARKLGDKRLEASVLGQMGNAFGYAGELSQAIDYFEQALAIERKRRHAQPRNLVGESRDGLSVSR